MGLLMLANANICKDINGHLHEDLLMKVCMILYNVDTLMIAASGIFLISPILSFTYMIYALVTVCTYLGV